MSCEYLPLHVPRLSWSHIPDGGREETAKANLPLFIVVHKLVKWFRQSHVPQSTPLGCIWRQRQQYITHMLLCRYCFPPFAGRTRIPLAIVMDKGDTIVVWESSQVCWGRCFWLGQALWRQDKVGATSFDFKYFVRQYLYIGGTSKHRLKFIRDKHMTAPLL